MWQKILTSVKSRSQKQSILCGWIIREFELLIKLKATRASCEKNEERLIGDDPDQQ